MLSGRAHPVLAPVLSMFYPYLDTDIEVQELYTTLGNPDSLESNQTSLLAIAAIL